MRKGIIENFILLLRYNLGTLILFELFHKGIALILVLPIIKYIFESAMHNSGMIYLSTDNVFKILTNPISIFLLILLLLIFGFYVFFEFTATIICFDKSIRYEKIGIFKLIKLGLQKSVRILNIKNYLLMIFILLIIPLTNLTLTSGFIGELKLPEYILDFIKSNKFLNIVYMGLMIILYMIVIRWIFSIHEITLNRSSFKEAKNESNRITKGKTIKIFLYSVGTFIVFSLIGYGIYYLLIILMAIVIKYYGIGIDLKEIFIAKAILFKDYSMLIASISSFILNLAFISAIYYNYKNFGFYNNKYNKIKISSIKKIITVLLIVILIPIESMALSINSNTLLNIELFYNTTATAHRGGNVSAPENTLAAFKEAILAQVEYIETDVQETKDGELILIHDSNFKRTTGVDKNVWEVDYEEVKNYDAGNYMNLGYTGAKIPTLDEAIKYVRGRCKLLIEIKLNGHESPDIIDKVISVIKKNRAENQCVIASMDKEVLKKVKEIDSNFLTCYLTALAYGDIYTFEYVDIYGIESTFITKGLIKNIHDKGKQIFVWTVNDQDMMSKMIDLNVDSIITDNPFLLNDTLYSKKNDFIKVIADYLF